MVRNYREVRVGRVGKPHGIKGEVTVEVFTDSPTTRFSTGNVLSVQTKTDSGKSFDMVTVESFRWHKKVLLVKFDEVIDRTAAELLRNAELYASISDFSEADDGWYPEDLAGLPVFEKTYHSAKIGEVIDLLVGRAQDLLEIRLNDGHEILVPFVSEIVAEVDRARGVLILPPPGLLELNKN